MVQLALRDYKLNDTVVDELDKYIAANPTSFEAFYYKTLIHDFRSEDDLVIQCATRALELPGKSKQKRLNLLHLIADYSAEKKSAIANVSDYFFQVISLKSAKKLQLEKKQEEQGEAADVNEQAINTLSNEINDLKSDHVGFFKNYMDYLVKHGAQKSLAKLALKILENFEDTLGKEYMYALPLIESEILAGNAASLVPAVFTREIKTQMNPRFATVYTCMALQFCDSPLVRNRCEDSSFVYVSDLFPSTLLKYMAHTLFDEMEDAEDCAKEFCELEMSEEVFNNSKEFNAEVNYVNVPNLLRVAMASVKQTTHKEKIEAKIKEWEIVLQKCHKFSKTEVLEDK